MQYNVLNIVNYYKLNVIETTKKEFKFRGLNVLHVNRLIILPSVVKNSINASDHSL